MVITESSLRAQAARCGERILRVGKGDIVTQAAWDYIKDHGIAVQQEQPTAQAGGKPEHMTHLHGDLLVSKNHPRILFRGKIDTLQAKLLETQIAAAREGLNELVEQLEEIAAYVRDILACEVKAAPFERTTLLGMDEAQLRERSHHPERFCSAGHRPPSYRMGETAVWLNSARTLAREAELAAVTAFTNPDGTVERIDLIQALNRLSSAIYILFCIRADQSEQGGATWTNN